MLLSAPAIILTAAVTLLALLISVAFAIGVARARRRTKIDAPAMSGHPDLERALRIQGNTVEQIVLFLPALFSVGNSGTLGVAIVGLIVFGLGWGFFDSNNMPILSQIARPEWRATGYGIMNMVSISCGGFGDWAFGALRDRAVPLNLIFGVFAAVALLSVGIVLMIRPRGDVAYGDAR